MNVYPYALPVREGLLEVVDAKDRPLMLMPKEDVLHHNLRHRKVRVVLRDAFGRILLVRAACQGTVPVWALPGSLVRAGESRIDAALRMVEQELGMSTETIQLVQTQTIRGKSLNSIAIFLGEIPHNEEIPFREDREILKVDMDELNGLAKHFSDMLAPDLLQTATLTLFMK